jgi:hypothetical protein
VRKDIEDRPDELERSRFGLLGIHETGRQYSPGALVVSSGGPGHCGIDQRTAAEAASSCPASHRPQFDGFKQIAEHCWAGGSNRAGPSIRRPSSPGDLVIAPLLIALRRAG